MKNTPAACSSQKSGVDKYYKHTVSKGGREVGRITDWHNSLSIYRIRPQPEETIRGTVNRARGVPTKARAGMSASARSGFPHRAASPRQSRETWKPACLYTRYTPVSACLTRLSLAPDDSINLGEHLRGLSTARICGPPRRTEGNGRARKTKLPPVSKTRGQ